MKKILTKITLATLFFGLLYSTGLAFAPINFNLNPNDVAEFKPNIPDINNDEGAPFDNQVIRNKFTILHPLNLLIKAYDKTLVRLENAKHFSASEMDAIVQVIKAEKNEAKKIKREVERDGNFDEEKRNEAMDKFGLFSDGATRGIPKVVNENQVKHGKKVLTNLENVINKIKIYVGIAKNNNLEVDSVQSKLTKAENKLSMASNGLNEIERILGKINRGTGALKIKGYFEEINTKLKNVYKNIAETKDLTKEALKELKKVTKR
jgi:hypothetical protein